jgi:hypothetical protein
MPKGISSKKALQQAAEATGQRTLFGSSSSSSSSNNRSSSSSSGAAASVPRGAPRWWIKVAPENVQFACKSDAVRQHVQQD